VVSDTFASRLASKRYRPKDRLSEMPIRGTGEEKFLMWLRPILRWQIQGPDRLLKDHDE
jgi:hypothetical protein